MPGPKKFSEFCGNSRKVAARYGRCFRLDSDKARPEYLATRVPHRRENAGFAILQAHKLSLIACYHRTANSGCYLTAVRQPSERFSPICLLPSMTGALGRDRRWMPAAFSATGPELCPYAS